MKTKLFIDQQDTLEAYIKIRAWKCISCEVTTKGGGLNRPDFIAKVQFYIGKSLNRTLSS